MNTIRCPQCNLVNFSTAINCKRCGNFFQDVDLPPTEIVAPAVQSNVTQPIQPNFNAPNSVPQQTWTPPYQYQPSYQSSYPQNYSSSYQGSSTEKKLAIFSMIFGIFSFPLINMMVIGFLAAILGLLFDGRGAIAGVVIGLAILPMGLITGITALVKVKKYPNEYGGKGFAIAGVSLSGFGLLVIPIIAAIALPNLIAARMWANEASAIANLKILVKAQKDYNSKNKTTLCADLTSFLLTKSIDSTLASGTKSGYRFTMASAPTGCEFFATPTTVSGISATGERSFHASTNDDMIRGRDKNGLDTPVGSVFTNLGGQSEDSNITEITVVSNLQKIYSGQNYLYSNFKEYSGDLREMRAKQLISSTLANTEELGYIYVLKLTPSGGYEVFATPISPQQRSFYMNQDGSIHAEFKQGSAASKSDPTID